GRGGGRGVPEAAAGGDVGDGVVGAGERLGSAVAWGRHNRPAVRRGEVEASRRVGGIGLGRDPRRRARIRDGLGVGGLRRRALLVGALLLGAFAVGRLAVRLGLNRGLAVLFLVLRAE